uniref:Protein argonaute N-terminal domain-containing protein n=1 Tax=Anopheles maculatus TaxID=74869 RepID=A0A182SWW6_9DIPT
QQQQDPQGPKQKQGPQGPKQQQQKPNQWSQEPSQQQHQGPQGPKRQQDPQGPKQQQQKPNQWSQGPTQQLPQGSQQQQQQQGPQGPKQKQGPQGPKQQHGAQGPKQQQGPQQRENTQGRPGQGDGPATGTAGGSAVHRDASVSSTKSSGSGDGSLMPIKENIEQMRIAKEKIRRTDLRPVLVRSGAHGTRGKKVTVEANFFRLLLDKLQGVAYHYDVTIEPDRPKKFLRPVFAQFCRENYPNVPLAYDGQKSAYTTRKLAEKKGKVVFQPDDGGRAKEYSVQMKEAAQLDLGVLKTYMTSNDITFAKPMSAIQCLDVVLRCAYENNPNFVRFKRCVYMVPNQRIDLGKGHELWYGLFQSAVLGSRPYINLD